MLRVVSHCNLNGFDILEGGFWIPFYQVYGLSWMCWQQIWPADAEGLNVWGQPELHGHFLFTKEIMIQIFFLEISII